MCQKKCPCTSCSWVQQVHVHPHWTHKLLRQHFLQHVSIPKNGRFQTMRPNGRVEALVHVLSASVDHSPQEIFIRHPPVDRQHLLSYLSWQGCVRGVVVVAARLLSPRKYLLVEALAVYPFWTPLMLWTGISRHGMKQWCPHCWSHLVDVR